jgi:GNAT superfamily N-acetyltransferase
MAQQIEVRSFDPQSASPELWAKFHACRRAITAELYPDDPVLSDAEIEIEIRRALPLFDRRLWLALSGPEVIGSASAFFRRPGTPNADEHAPFLSGGLAVRAEERRRGAGTLLLQEIHGLMIALGKTMLTLGAHTESGHAFLTRAGAISKLTTIASRAPLAKLDWPGLRQWEDAAGNLGLVWECYAGRVPREVLLALLPEFTALFADVPLGELEVAPVRWEIEGYDHWYETINRVGGAHHLVLLKTADGSVVGLTEAEWDSRTPGIVNQALTAVARPWRGRGLARALKARLLRQVHAHLPEAETIRTGNAEGNAAMLSINSRAGFTAHRRFVEYQITREALDAWRAAAPARGIGARP